jgi:RecA-family ATPase
VIALIEEIIAVARTYSQKLVLIVLDALSALAPGMNENASQDVSMVRKRLVALQEKFGVAVILVHHKPKNSAPRAATHP